MDEVPNREEIRKGIRWDGSTIEFEYEEGDSVHQFLQSVEEEATILGISLEERINCIIGDYIDKQMRIINEKLKRRNVHVHNKDMRMKQKASPAR